jgi:hypothetical protein
MKLRVFHGRSQAGRPELDGDPAPGQRPVQGAARAEQGGRPLQPYGRLRLPAAGEPDRVIPGAAFWPRCPDSPPGRNNRMPADSTARPARGIRKDTNLDKIRQVRSR